MNGTLKRLLKSVSRVILNLMEQCLKIRVRSLTDWMALHSRGYVPIHDPEFQMYTEPLPLELAKQWDLRTLSKYLPPPLTQEQIDEWYPEPTAQQRDLEESDSDETTSDSN